MEQLTHELTSLSRDARQSSPVDPALMNLITSLVQAEVGMGLSFCFERLSVVCVCA